VQLDCAVGDIGHLHGHRCERVSHFDVVNLEDYKMKTIVTNITQPGSGAQASPDFSKFHGTMRHVS
jgi:hypothetical protein